MIGLGNNAKRKAAEYQQQRQIVLRADVANTTPPRLGPKPPQR
ncbi:hypothetical protein [Mesorhizobium sp.]|nr:hypothetical protein [Mesorhizobium sp.]